MPRHADLKKVMVIGSGPIVIGQAAEFDYAGAQACQALKEEGVSVVLVNSNPATIMTDPEMADAIYLEPLSLPFLTEILEKERPDGLLPTLGGQTGLNLAVELAQAGVLDRLGVRLLGTPLSAIQKAEDREAFRSLMKEIGEPVPDSAIVHSVAEAEAFAEEIGLPLIIRPAYTLGGTGGGFAETMDDLRTTTKRGLQASPIRQVLVERSLAGNMEIEFEVIRDSADQVSIVCDMENIDPVGVHTGDSIVVAPCQTLDAEALRILKEASAKIIRALGIEGGCNIQFSFNPTTRRYDLIEVNPRVSRSSALASKATGYPIARISAKIALGLALAEIPNSVTGGDCQGYEPKVEYVVTKFPRWPFDKFTRADRRLGTQMKATGEVMAIGPTFQSSLMKAIRSLELGTDYPLIPAHAKLSEEQLNDRIIHPDDQRLFLVAEALRRGQTPQELSAKTGIRVWFIEQIAQILACDLKNPENLAQAKALGITDKALAKAWGTSPTEVRQARHQVGLIPGHKEVPTLSASATSPNPYYYSSYQMPPAKLPTTQDKILVLGSGPIRIGQGIEFDYCSVHAAWAIQSSGREAIIINNNPETVSTDFSTADRLYFEPLHPEDVLEVIDREQPTGVLVQFGGQTAIGLAAPLAQAGVKILGTSLDAIDQAEDRERFDALLERLNIPRPPGASLTSLDEALEKARAMGYPLLVRPSYVLGGRAMEIVHNDEELATYFAEAVLASEDHPVLIDRYLQGTELEVDAVADGTDVLIGGILEHLERAGVHSGDSIAVYPAPSITPQQKETLARYTREIALGMGIQGLINIQFVIARGEVYVLEVNPRSSRTVPFLAKVAGIPLVQLATRVALGESLKDLGVESGLYPEPPGYAVKVPVFSFAKLKDVEITLGPEMKSTGEVIGRDRSLEKALYKGLVAAGLTLPSTGTVLATIADKDKEEALPILTGFYNLGYELAATAGTASLLRQAGLPVTEVHKLSEGSPNLVDLIRQDGAVLAINTLTRGKEPARDGFRIRRAAVERGVPCLTSLDTARGLLRALEAIRFQIKPL